MMNRMLLISKSPSLQLKITHGTGFTTDLLWSGGSGTFDLQRAFASDYSDATTIYTGTAHTYQDTESILTGYCYYRVRVNSGAWVSENLYVTISDATNDTLTCFYGNSITYGYNLTPITKSFAKNWYVVRGWTTPTTGDIIGLPDYSITSGVSSGLTWNYTSGGDAMPSKSNARNYCIMGYGINDARYSVTSSAYQTALENWIDYAVSIGWPVGRIIILGPFYNPTNTTNGNNFRDAARTAATNKGAAFLSVLDFQVANSLTPPDNLHPTQTHHLLIDFWLAKHIEGTGEIPITPSVVSATVTSATNIRVVFDTNVQVSNVGWSFKKNGSANNPTAVSGSDTNTINFTVPTITTGQTITYSYDQSTGDTYGLIYHYSLQKTTATNVSVINPL